MVSDNPQTMATTLKEVYGIKGNDTTMHKEATEVRIKRDEDDVNEQVECFTLIRSDDQFIFPRVRYCG